VKRGEGQMGPMGGDDTKYTMGVGAMKDGRGMHLREWQKMLYKNSIQYKDIAAKWKLSDEHPGMNYLPDFTGEHYFRRPYNHGLLYSSFAGMKSFGPRFTDSPLNQDCITKAMACVKYTMLGAIPFAINRALGESVQEHRFNFRAFAKQYARLAPRACIYTATWGGMVCTAASIRNKDDAWNMHIAALFVGLVAGTIHTNMRVVVRFYMGFAFMGVLWQALRTHEKGFIGSNFTRGNVRGPVWMHNLVHYDNAVVPKKDW